MSEKSVRDPEKTFKIVAFALLIVLWFLIGYFHGDMIDKSVKLAVSGDVEALAAYFRSFGPWAIAVSFVLDVLVNAGSVFPSIFISTANGLIFGLPLGIVISWLAETTGVVISFLLMRYFFRDAAEKMISKSSFLQKIDDVSGKEGFKWMTLSRMLPYFPSGILTAVGAVSKMSLCDYVLANLIGKFPSTAMEVVIGHDIVNYQKNMTRLTIMTVVIILIFVAYDRYSKKHKEG